MMIMMKRKKKNLKGRFKETKMKMKNTTIYPVQYTIHQLKPL